MLKPGWLDPIRTHAGVGMLYTLTETLNGQWMRSVLDTCLLESAEKLFNLPMQCYLLHDNSSNHKDKSVVRWLHGHGITVMDFPPYSPDLNPIENWIADVKKRQHRHVVADVEELQMQCMKHGMRQIGDICRNGCIACRRDVPR